MVSIVERSVSERPEYGRQPLVEAIFELFADSEQDATWTHDTLPKLTALFPDFTSHEEQLRDFGIGIEVEPNGSIKRTTHLPRERVRRWDASRQQAVQFGPHMCAHNVLGSAYQHCPNHLPVVARTVRAYLDVVKPAKLAWIGQRYINAIEIPITDDDVASYFEIYPKLPRGLVGHRPIAIQLQTIEVKNGLVLVNLSLQDTDTDHATYVLDVYARSSGAVPLDADGILHWQEEAHKGVSDSFELSISDRSRIELFKRVR